jgi:hypothetical protein
MVDKMLVEDGLKLEIEEQSKPVIRAQKATVRELYNYSHPDDGVSSRGRVKDRYIWDSMRPSSRIS